MAQSGGERTFAACTDSAPLKPFESLVAVEWRPTEIDPPAEGANILPSYLALSDVTWGSIATKFVVGAIDENRVPIIIFV